MIKRMKIASRLATVLVIAAAGTTVAQEGGVFTAGDLWDSFFPSNAGSWYREVDDDPTARFTLFRIGNWDRQWTTPSQTYPGGENLHLPWGQDMQMMEYSPDEINITTDSNAPRAKQYLHGFYTNNLAGAGDAGRNFTSPGAYWVDDGRNEMRYEGAMPTNLGVDVRWRMRQFAANHANLNDFIVVELELTNTGVLDADGDGTAEKTDNRIHALTLHMQNEPINSMTNRNNGRRGSSGWFTGPTSGYDATPDASGAPWDVPVIFTGPRPSDLGEPHPVFGSSTGWSADGARLLGVTMRSRGYYYDIYNGMQWLAAKQGALPASGSSASAEDKRTIYDSHPVGVDGERGWFTSVLKDDGGYRNPRENHIYAMAAFFDGDQIGSRAWDKGAAIQNESSLVPDPNWFDPNHSDIVPGDPSRSSMPCDPKASAASRWAT